MYAVIDVKQDSQLSCIYSGYTITLDLSLDPSKDAYNKGINAEHTWPQSMGSGSEPQKSDLHHLFPCKANVNSSRGNDPFDEIPDEDTDKWFRNDTVLTHIPTEFIEEYAEKENDEPHKFEPREDHKGNTARAMFYFYAMYHDAADSSFWHEQKDVLSKWHYYDPVDEREYDRTWVIAGYQDDKPNPFVLDSTLARRTWFSEDMIVEGRSYILDDFDYEIDGNINDFFANRGVWNTPEAQIEFSIDSVSGRNYALELKYDISAPSSQGGWWEHLTYSYASPDSPAYDLSEFDKFHFSYKGNDIYTTSFIIEFIEGNFQNRHQISVDGVCTNWQEKVIDLKESLGDLDLTKVSQIAIVLKHDDVTQTKGTLYFDNLYFVDSDEGYDTNDQLLDLICRKPFEFFVENVHPQTGLIRDKASSRNVSSISSIGFGLAALGIGVEREWISRDEAADRTRKILKTLYDAPQGPNARGYAGYKGFFYHLLNIETVERDGDSELSSVDTAILLAGLLFSREYFDGSDPVEEEIRNLADSIFYRVDWNWMLDTTRNQFRMAWTPETSFDNWWNYYTDEAILICLLAVASGQVDSTVFYAWEREQGTYGDYTLIQTWWGSLFTHFFAHCWIRFDSLRTDAASIDWWENSKNAVNANRQFCIDSSAIYPTYGENSWGLSACLGPNGYNGGKSKSYGAKPLGDSPSNHDGTIPPYGAGSSIIFFSNDREQNESVKALRNYYDNYPKLWGLYGFKDAYNLGVASDSLDDWYADEYFGIDVGPMLLMIENYRTGLVWNHFMSNEQIKKAIEKIFTRNAHVDEYDFIPPKKFLLLQNYPNPFNPATTIRYDIARKSEVSLLVYNILGHRVRQILNQEHQPGNYSVTWDGKDSAGNPVPSGIYLCTLDAISHESDKEFHQMRKMILLR